MQTDHLSSEKELSNDQIRVQIQHKDACQVEFHVTVSKSMLDKARLDAAKAVNKEVVLPGFRKGKAPDAMVLKKFPYDVEKRFHKCLADLAFVDAQKMAKVPVLNNNTQVMFDVKKMSDDSADLLFVFETEPKVPSVDPKQFAPKEVEKKQVGEKEVDEAIRQMAFFYAAWQPVSDRAIQEGDFIIIDLDTVDGDKETSVFKGVRFEVKPERMASWMRNLVLNAKMGDVLEGISEPDDTATDAEKAEFAPKKVKIKILTVESAQLPEINDEFAARVGAPDVKGMRDLVEGILKNQIEDKANEDFREQVNQFLVNNYSFELPKSIVNAEFEHRYNQAKKNPEFKAHIEKISDAERKKIEDRILNETINSLKLFYLSKQIVADGKISVSHKEVQDQAVKERRNRMMAMESSDKLSKEEYALALSMVFLHKAQDYVIEKQKA